MNPYKVKEVVLTHEQLVRRIKELALWINQEYKDSKNLVLIGIMKGAFAFYAELVKHIKVECYLEFIRVRSYSGTATTNKIELVNDIDSDISGKDVLIVEGVLDTGMTLDFVKKMLQDRGPASLKVMVLLSKNPSIKVDAIGFDMPNQFLVGFGCDVDGYFRQLDHICVLES